MRISFLMIMAACTVLLVSCNEDADDLRANDIYGSWEKIHYNEDLDLNYVDTYSFNANGTFERHGTLRDPETQDLIGYNSFQNGGFSLNGNAIQLQNISYLWTEEWYADLEDLEPVHGNFDNQAVLSLQDGKSELIVDFGPCNDVILAMCMGPQTYLRVSGN